MCQKYRILFMQEMIRRGVLFQGVLLPPSSLDDTNLETICRAFEGAWCVYRDAFE